MNAGGPDHPDRSPRTLLRLPVRAPVPTAAEAPAAAPVTRHRSGVRPVPPLARTLLRRRIRTSCAW